MASKKEHPAVAALRKDGATKVKVACSDIDGVLRGKVLHIDKFLGAAEPYPGGGFGFCDVVFGWDSQDACYDNAQVTGWQHGFPDALARLDLDTARRVPVGTAACRSSSATSSPPTAAVPGVPEADPEAGPRARREARRAADVRRRVRVVQLRRDAAVVGRQARRRAGDDHPRHVRL